MNEILPKTFEPNYTWEPIEDDVWLSKALEAKVGSGLLWQFFVAVGMYVRFRTHTDRKALVETLLSGIIPPKLEVERRWVKTLEFNTLEYMVTNGLTATESLHRTFHELSKVPTKNEVLHLLYLRDDIASGLLLLDAAGVGGPIHQALVHADALGESLRDVFQPHMEGDERLRRAGIANPEGWWVPTY